MNPDEAIEQLRACLDMVDEENAMRGKVAETIKLIDHPEVMTPNQMGVAVVVMKDRLEAEWHFFELMKSRLLIALGYLGVLPSDVTEKKAGD